MKTPKNIRAFTLIELLVVISIIAILAGIALPVFSQVQERGAQTKALSNAKQIGLACKIFAQDNNGNYPTYTLGANLQPSNNDVTDSNTAFAELFPDYLKTESIFFVAKSAFTPSAPDEKIDDPALPSPSDTLKSGENHWAYVIHLTDTSDSRFPLIADGFDSPTSHTYTEKEADKGGVWKGKKAIIIRCDISGSIEKVNSTSKTVKLSPKGDDLFNTSETNWLSTTQKVVNPK